MQALDIPDAAKYARTRLLTKRPGTGMPANLILGRALGSGSNSRVCRALLVDEHVDPRDAERMARLRQRASREGTYVVRTPLRESDTIKQSHAVFEFEMTALGAHLGVAPALFDAWYVPQTTKTQRRGLHVIMERYQMDLADAITKWPEELTRRASALSEQLVGHFELLAGRGVFMYDVKPCNTVLNLDPVRVRLIDFGKDFCEKWKSSTADVTAHAEKALQRQGCMNVANMTTVLRVTMMILMSAACASVIHEERRELKLHARDRAKLNVLHDAVQRARGTCTPAQVRVIKEILRHESVRSNTRHYLGKRNSAVKRVFRLANFASP